MFSESRKGAARDESNHAGVVRAFFPRTWRMLKASAQKGRSLK